MMGKTHATVGANAAWVAFALGEHGIALLLMLAVGAFGGLLPDIDAPSARIHFVGGGILGGFRGIFRHRGFFHSLLAALLLFLVALAVTARFFPLAALVFGIGYLSHLLIDGFNYKKSQYLYPWRQEFNLVPKWMATPVRGLGDNLLFVFGILGIALLLVRGLVLTVDGSSVLQGFLLP